MQENFCWWKHGIIYHIYPQSFYDANEDGLGDLQGITQKLDYLSQLGIDAIWLSPIYSSPLIDGGYDITDHTSINPLFGTMKDFTKLLETAHKKNIRIIMDLVLNHTSNLHPWFQESRSSLHNPKRHWYIWQPAKNNRLPNNWRTNFGKKAWKYDPQTGEYYYHSFFYEQPDLNWRNPKVQEAMFNVAKFWLEHGIDGFRLDVINMLYKDKKFRDNPFKVLPNGRVFNRNRGSVYKMLKEFRQLLDTYPDKSSVGEIYAAPPGDSKLVSNFLGSGNDMLHLAFDFSLIFTRWKASSYYKTITEGYNKLARDSWPCFFLSNHDVGRSTNHFIITLHKYKKAKLHAILLMTLKGTPFIYYGDEIGMENVSIAKDQIRDLYGKIFYPFFNGRDGFRTPMQWEDKIHAGFSKVTPWLPPHKNYNNINVNTQMHEQDSIYTTYKKLIALRKQHKVLQYGDINFLGEGKNNILMYKRQTKDEKFMILLNFSFRKKSISFTANNITSILFNTHPDKTDILQGKITLQPYQGLVLQLC